MNPLPTNLWAVTPAHIVEGVIEAKLWNLRRFQGHPKALCVRPHTHLVRMLAMHGGAGADVVEWAYHHDDHEAITGDLNGLVERLIADNTPVLTDLKNHLDRVICEARGLKYPTPGVRREVHFYDKLAESLEWQFGLGHEDGGFHPEWPDWLDRRLAERMFRAHASLTSPYS